jgi:hypothetical protein
VADEPILYTQAGCAESARVRSWLSDRGIAFTERSASTDLAAARELYATGLFATPLLVVGDETVLGYRPRALADALRTARERR